MAELSPLLLELRDMSRELGGELRTMALALDADPADTEMLRESPTLSFLRVVGTPKAFRAYDVPAHAEQFTESCLGRVVCNIELARGDVSVLQAVAAPSLAGFTVDALGDAAQQDAFYRDFAKYEPWTFFGMTEARGGSDATAMHTSLDPDGDGGFLLNGAKRYVANADRGLMGVVWARTGTSSLSIRAVLLRRPAPGFSSSSLDMLGMRGARFGEMVFDAVPVPREMLLGAHLPASRRGLWGGNRAFTVVRLQIAAQALGAAFAVRDAVCALRPGWTGHELMSARLDAARELLYDAAVGADLDPDARIPVAVAKVHAAELAVETTRWAESALPPGTFLDHPLLEKWCRDIYAYQFMDGTSNLLRLAIAPSAGAHGEDS
ncbi:acyl-CoA/acyl-ACP dehydrogenase [Actinospica durhamensis]|uniref:Acyl-CoA/acyl-ACP dehydrogenase n=1 Tax=Actinospica durhamensis TaxID=1508375 RepID=A0A941EKY1_9ACTN|nr:acyl-CoA dehydrogenase family protein [Actinospica durhamensis]MBR7833522.1 acyl-CoA/acyl-ACP dehydrogenase [Actinospica durhamensis]